MLSESEVINRDYGFESHNVYGKSRIRITTDYAKANNAMSFSTFDKANEGGYWWLRSPDYSYFGTAGAVTYDGLDSRTN